jgi:hypothetical protein
VIILEGKKSQDLRLNLSSSFGGMQIFFYKCSILKVSVLHFLDFQSDMLPMFPLLVVTCDNMIPVTPSPGALLYCCLPIGQLMAYYLTGHSQTIGVSDLSS